MVVDEGHSVTRTRRYLMVWVTGPLGLVLVVLHSPDCREVEARRPAAAVGYATRKTRSMKAWFGSHDDTTVHEYCCLCYIPALHQISSTSAAAWGLLDSAGHTMSNSEFPIAKSSISMGKLQKA